MWVDTRTDHQRLRAHGWEEKMGARFFPTPTLLQANVPTAAELSPPSIPSFFFSLVPGSQAQRIGPLPSAAAEVGRLCMHTAPCAKSYCSSRWERYGSTQVPYSSMLFWWLIIDSASCRPHCRSLAKLRLSSRMLPCAFNSTAVILYHTSKSRGSDADRRIRIRHWRMRRPGVVSRSVSWHDAVQYLKSIDGICPYDPASLPCEP